MRNLISKAAIKEGNSKMPVVIDCSHISQADFTAAEGFHAMLGDFKKRHQSVYWLAINPCVIHTLRAIAGDNLKLINGPIELACKSRQESPKSLKGTVTEMVTITEEAVDVPSVVLRKNTPKAITEEAVDVPSVVLRKNTPKEIPKSFATFY